MSKMSNRYELKGISQSFEARKISQKKNNLENQELHFFVNNSKNRLFKVKNGSNLLKVLKE
jgi:hypothetical protein